VFFGNFQRIYNHLEHWGILIGPRFSTKIAARAVRQPLYFWTATFRRFVRRTFSSFFAMPSLRSDSSETIYVHPSISFGPRLAPRSDRVCRKTLGRSLPSARSFLFRQCPFRLPTSRLLARNNFARHPCRIDAKCGDHFRQTDLTCMSAQYIRKNLMVGQGTTGTTADYFTARLTVGLQTDTGAKHESWQKVNFIGSFAALLKIEPDGRLVVALKAVTIYCGRRRRPDPADMKKPAYVNRHGKRRRPEQGLPARAAFSRGKSRSC
jgi:hypothetical protein